MGTPAEPAETAIDSWTAQQAGALFEALARGVRVRMELETEP